MFKMKFTESDIKFMKRAIVIARKGGQKVSPNPKVGAVLVQDQLVIAEGWHNKFGGNHAEVEALNKFTKTNLSKKGALTLFVTLEPCSHFGKTPPCIKSIIESGVTRVVIAVKDPNPLVSGSGILALQKAGIRVDVGCCSDDALELIMFFSKWIKTGLPFVSLKVAMSLDGKIATKTGDSKWITSQKSRNYVRKLRANYDAILVGKNTVLNDDPELAAGKYEPIRVVLDSNFEVKLSARVFRNSNAILITTERAPIKKIAALRELGVLVKVFKGSVKIKPLLRFLGSQNITSVFVEGGAEVFGSFVDINAVDSYLVFIAPKIIGGRDAKAAIAGSGFSKLTQAITFKKTNSQKIGDDYLIEALV